MVPQKFFFFKIVRSWVIWWKLLPVGASPPRINQFVFLKLCCLHPLNMKIATINNDGLDSRKNTLIQYMNQNNFDIYCLQETHKISLQNFNFIEKKTLIL